MESTVVLGNALTEGKQYQGWFVGHFVQPTSDPRSLDQLEIKWGTHRKGDRRAQWTTQTQVTSISILIQGRFRLEFCDRQVVLSQPGDYAFWLPGVEHCWEAEEDCTVLTVRFPSQ